METPDSNRNALIALAVVLGLAALCWIALLSPKRSEASKLADEVAQQEQVLTEAQTRVTEARAAKKAFPGDYRRMIELGKAAPEGDETASLIVALNRIAYHSHVAFSDLTLQTTSETPVAEALAPEAGPTSNPTPAPPTEAAAALLPLGASVGSANLAVMPYTLTFEGEYFHVADFIRGVERMVRTNNSGTDVNGRLITLDGFALTHDNEGDKHLLKAEFSVTTYVVPPSQGTTAGATELGPEEGAPAPEATVPSGAPEAAEAANNATASSYSTGEAR